MPIEFPTNPAPMTPSDEQIAQSLISEIAAISPEQEHLEEQNRLAWERDRAKIEGFFKNPFKYLTEFWQQYKSIIINSLLVAVAIFAVKIVVSLIGFITHLLFLNSLFELIGMGYTGWFVYRYLLKAETRQELSAKLEEIKQGVIGATEEIVGDTSIGVKKSVTIQKSPEELYRFWRNFENLPRFMNHLEAVQTIDEKRSHWIAKAPLNTTVEWDAEIIDEKENKSIVWRSLEGAEVDSVGSVAFTNANGSGTEVKVTMKYSPPAGIVGATAAALFGENPQQQLDEDLERLKQVMEMSAI